MKTNEVQSSTSLWGWGCSGCPSKPLSPAAAGAHSSSCTTQRALSQPGHPSAMPQHLPQDTGPLSQRVLQLGSVFKVSGKCSVLCIIQRLNTIHVLPQQLLCLQLQSQKSSAHTAAAQRSLVELSFISRYQEKYPWLRVQLSQFQPSLLSLFHLESLGKFGFSFWFVWYFKLFQWSRDRAVPLLVLPPLKIRSSSTALRKRSFWAVHYTE